MLYMDGGLLLPNPHALAMGFSSQQETHHHLLRHQERLLHLCGANGRDSGAGYGGFGFLAMGDDAPLAMIGVTTTEEGNMAKASSASDCSLGGEQDLFYSPKGIMEGAGAITLHSVPATTVSNLSGGEEEYTTILETINASDMAMFEHKGILNEVFYECRNDVSPESTIEELFPELADIEFPSLQLEEANGKAMKEGEITDGMMMMMMMQKSVSYGSLASEEWIGGLSVKPSFLDFQEVDFGAAFGMRRAYSEGDIKTLGKGEANLPATGVVCPVLERTLAAGSYKIEDRQEKLSRYRKKKSQRNFGRKIKYACRKALADNQPRVRGRFARTEDFEGAKPSK